MPGEAAPRSLRGRTDFRQKVSQILERFRLNERKILFWICLFGFTLHLISYLLPPHGVSDSVSHIREWVPNTGVLLGHWKDSPIVHPIPRLMAEAQTKYKNMISGQSKTLDQAVEEYKNRYKRDPPKGFDEWFVFAKENGVKIIDEYDGMIRDFAPFWELSGAEIRRRSNQVGTLPSIDLVRVKDGNASMVNLEKGFVDTEVSHRSRGFGLMIAKFQHTLPDMDFPINAKAEGRVLIPWEQRLFPNLTARDSSKGIESVLGGPFIADWRGDSNVWEAYRKTCDPTTQSRRLFQSLRAQLRSDQRPRDLLEEVGLKAGPDDDFQFISKVEDDFDFCNNPSTHYDQGLFFSDWRTIPALYPVFSPAKSNGYSDIVIPSHYYYTPSKRYTYGWDPLSTEPKDVDDSERPWSEKSNKIFWRGATTGGGSTPPGFMLSYQRHRFVRMISDKGTTNRTVVFADPPGTNNFIYAKVPVAGLNAEITDVAFTKALGCLEYPGGCDGLRKEHRFANAVPLGEHWKHKYLIDVDGMGYSARLFAFLASDSAVLKATVYREFFSDWIQPWLHYIPISASYKELYNIHAYFSGPTAAMTRLANSTRGDVGQKNNPRPLDGDAQLHRIARAGRRWKSTIGRKEDMEAYVYRLCLEWARLWSDDREAMSYKKKM